jgi:hypothetical protein
VNFLARRGNARRRLDLEKPVTLKPRTDRPADGGARLEPFSTGGVHDAAPPLTLPLTLAELRRPEILKEAVASLR